METVHDRLSLSATLEAFNALLKEKAGHEAQASVWFKESNARNLRHRDFLAPQAALKARFAGGQVPSDIVESMNVLKCPRVPPIQSCQMVPAGLTVKLARPAVFEQILKAVPVYTKPLQAAHEQHSLLLNCVPLHECQDLKSLSLDHLRAILVTDHLAGLLQTQGIDVHLTPSLSNEELQTFLHQLRVEWPLAREACPNLDPVLAMKEALRQCPHAEFTQMQQDGVFCKLHLKKFLEETQLQEAYDPKLDIFLVTEENLHQVAEVQRVALQCVASAPGRSFSVVHVVNSKEAFQQQKVDLLWRLVSPQAFTHLQKHLVCGPVKTIHSASPLNALEFSQLRHSQMYKASVLKYGDLSQDDTWTEIISTLTTAAIRFEILSIAHQNQILLDVEEMSISTKGTKSGAFVMYNCARLATLFEAYKKAEEQGLYPPFPAPSELDYFSLREEGEWLLLFNGVLPFQEVLSQGMQLPITSSGVRLTANTDAICKFLIQLSMDFSSYYNRVHILGEPCPHLFSQMFARLQLMRAVREVLHSALATLHLPPLSQI